jgi:hypothetical protein
MSPPTVLDSAMVSLPQGGPLPHISFTGGVLLEASERYWVTARTVSLEDGILVDLLWGQLAGPVPGTVARRSAGDLDPNNFAFPSAPSLGLRVFGVPEPTRALLSLLGLGAVLTRRRR